MTSGKKPRRRNRVLHRQSHTNPIIISANAQIGIDGRRATAPFVADIEWASHSSRLIEPPHRNQKGLPSPAESNSSATASSGMMTKVVSGMATMFAPTP
jgi:hypothetical protein